MTRDQLLQSAQKLVQPSAASAAEFTAKSETLAAVMNDQFRKRKDLAALVGDQNLDMMLDNHRNHIRFFCSLFVSYNPEVLVETVLWVFRTYRSHGFNLAYWPAQLDTWVEICKSELSASCFSEIYPFYHWMIVNNPVFARLSEEVLMTSSGPDMGLHSKHTSDE